MNQPAKTYPRPSLVLAVIPVVALILLLIFNVLLYGDSATSGPNQIALLLAAGVAALAGWSLKIPFTRMLEGITTSLGSALGAILILLMIGALTGTWLISGIVPAMIYYGLKILEPQFFLCAATIVCAIVSVATGSSWSTVATVGIALMGIGSALGISQPLTAGAIISGAYFGDKLSPLSDTTNLAAAMAGTNLITHIRYMLWTTVPSISLALGLYFLFGYFVAPAEVETANVAALSELISNKFNISPWLFLVPAAVLVLVLMKVDALVALFVGTILGAVFAVYLQPEIVRNVGEGHDISASVESWPEWSQNTAQYAVDSYVATVNAMSIDTKLGPKKLSDAEQKAADAGDLSTLTPQQNANVLAKELLKSKGMVGMLNTIWLIVCAMCFGGVMEACGLLKRITDPLVQIARSTGSLIATTAASCLFLNFTASDQYLAIVVPGRMFRQTYRDRKLAPQNLSRTLEDSGTVTSVLIPWNTCGAVQASVLGVLTISYAPYCFFNLISPLMTIIVGFIGFRIARLAINDKQAKA